MRGLRNHMLEGFGRVRFTGRLAGAEVVAITGRKEIESPAVTHDVGGVVDREMILAGKEERG